jgi:hypothetical protein
MGNLHRNNAERRSVLPCERCVAEACVRVPEPEYTSTHPASRSGLSVKPPQRTPMVGMPALRAPTAS